MSRPLGYASAARFQDHLNVPLSETDQAKALTYLAAAEKIVEHHTGRTFLPLNLTLAAAATDSATTLTFGTGGDRLPDLGYLLIDDEVVEYGGGQPTETGFVIDVVSRAARGTTAAAHDAGTAVYVVKGFCADTKQLYPGDFLRLIRAWNGKGDWTERTITTFTPGPGMQPPYQTLQVDHGFTPGVWYWFAAIWGYAYRCPEPITLATLRIAEEVWRRRGHWTLISRQQVEGITTVFRDLTLVPADVRELLEPYRVRRC